MSLDCPLQQRCPGCPLGGEAYELGLLRKRTALEQALEPYELSFELLAPRAAVPTTAYRLRAKLVVAGKALGLYERGTHQVMDIRGCRVLSPELTEAAELLRGLLPLPIYGADLRATSEGVMLTLLTDEARARPRLEAAAHALGRQGILSVAISVRRGGSVRLLSGEPEVVRGPAQARHRLSDALPYAYAAPGGFVQAHAGQAAYVQQAIVERLTSALGGLAERRVLELFAGSGVLALTLARAGAKVSAVEAYTPAIELAARAAAEQQLAIDAVSGDAARYAATVARRQSFHAAIVNPPRRGLAVELRRALAGSTIETLAYVSCSPRTLARDAQHLTNLGFALETVEPLDMIPWSEAVEALAWFVRRPPPAPRVLFDQDGWLAVEKGAWEPTASLQERLRASIAPRAVALDDWQGASGVCWFARDEAAEVTLRAALARAQRELSVLVRGNLRKQGTIMRRGDGTPRAGSRYRKARAVARHSLVEVLTADGSEAGTLRDFAAVGHPVLGDAQYGDARSNDHVEHRHGLDRAFVHCVAVKLTSESGKPFEVTSELAPDLRQALASIESD